MAAMLGSTLFPKILKAAVLADFPDIAVIHGKNLYNNTKEAIKRIGGMGKFVPPGSKVGILINSGFTVKGAYVNPDVSLAVLDLCNEAGAGEIKLLQHVKEEYWEKSSLYKKHRRLLKKIKNNDVNKHPSKFDEENWVLHENPNALNLKKAEIIKDLFECDVYINIPISKHHQTSILTGALKNMMGVCTRQTNVGFHLDGPERNDPQYLAECIADLNMVKKTDLVVVDSSEFITTNGPAGPGEMKTLNKVVAGTDIVAIDTLCTSYLGYEKEDVPTLAASEKAELGTTQIRNLIIQEIEGE